MLHGKNPLKDSLIVQRIYRRYIQPHLPRYEPETYILRTMKFDCCVDVGAHAGTYSILLSHNSRHVYAFEPTKHSFDVLRALRIGNVILFNVALGSESGETEITLPCPGGETDFALATLRPLAAGEYETVDRQRVTVAAFDAFEPQIDFSRIDFVKIDVEGFEMQVLRGMKHLLETRRPAFLIEIEQRHNPGYREVFKLLASLDYAPYVTVDGVALRAFDVDALPDVQTNEKLRIDEGRRFRLGERKNYLNNFFFLQPKQKSQFHAD